VSLHWDALGREDLVLEGEHVGGRAVDVPGERDRSGQDRLQQLSFLDARRRVLVLDDQRRGGEVDVEQLTGRELFCR
jgi:hypothetical protein